MAGAFGRRPCSLRARSRHPCPSLSSLRWVPSWGGLAHYPIKKKIVLVGHHWSPAESDRPHPRSVASKVAGRQQPFARNRLTHFTLQSPACARWPPFRFGCFLDYFPKRKFLGPHFKSLKKKLNFQSSETEKMQVLCVHTEKNLRLSLFSVFFLLRIRTPLGQASVLQLSEMKLDNYSLRKSNLFLKPAQNRRFGTRFRICS